MTVLGEAIVKIRTDDTGLDGDFDNIRRRADGLGGALKTALATAGGFVIAQGLLKLPGVIADATGAASNLNETVSKSNTVFGDSARRVEDWASGGAKNFGLSKQAALDAASGFGNMFDQLGIGTEHAADLSTGMVELAADFASFHNADITEVLNAQSSAFRGEYDALQRFLPTISAATVEQKALEMTGKATTKELTAQEKALAVQALMFEGAGQAMGDFDRTSDSLANRQRILRAEFDNLQARIGNALLPVFVAIAGFILDSVIPAFDRLVTVIGTMLAPVIQSIQTYVQGLIAQFKAGAGAGGELRDSGSQLADVFTSKVLPVLQNIGQLILAVVENFIKFGTTIAESVIKIVEFGIQSGILGATLTGLEAILNIIGSAIVKITTFLAENEIIAKILVATLAALLVVLFPIPAAIIAIVTVVGLLIENWSTLEAATRSVWNALPSPIQAALDFILDYVVSRIQGVIGAFENMFNIVTNVVSLFANLIQGDWSAAWQNAQNIANEFLNLILNIIQSIFGQIPGIILGAMTDAFNAFRDLLQQLLDFGTNTLQSLVDNVINFFSQIPPTISGFMSEGLNIVIDFGTQMLNNMIDFLQQILDNNINFWGRLPGIAFDAITGMINTIRDNIGNAIGTARELAEGVGNEIWNVLKGLVNTGRDAIWELINGMVSVDLFGEVTNFVRNAIPEAIRNLLGIGSPSRVMFGFGVNIIEGLINGIKEKLPGLASTAAAAAGMVWDAASGAAGAVKNLAGDLLDAGGNIVSDIGGAISGLFAGGQGNSQPVENWRSLVARYFPASQVNNALRVMQLESGGNPSAWKNDAIEDSRGLFQINVRAHGTSMGNLFDPETNVRYASELYARQGWGPWTAARMLGLAGFGAKVKANEPWIVGDRGWEIFVPNQSGRILSNEDSKAALAKAGEINVNFLGTNYFQTDNVEQLARNHAYVFIQGARRRGMVLR